MEPWRRVLTLSGIASVLVLAACARDDPNAPGVHTISGRVVLTGFLVADGGRFAGTKVVGDADGVVTELVFGDRVIARASTVDGSYRFAGLAPGSYVVRARVLGAVGDTTNGLTIANADVAARDTLRLISHGDLYPVPNPIGAATRIFFDLADSQHVQFRIEDLSGNVIRTLLDSGLGAGLNEVFWDGRDEAGQLGDGPMYWAIFESGDDLRAQLLFR